MSEWKPCGACSGGVPGWLDPLVCDKPEGHDGGHEDSRMPGHVFAFATFHAPAPRGSS